jgi:hypothetical protein
MRYEDVRIVFPSKSVALQGNWRMIRGISAVYAPDFNSRASHVLRLRTIPAFDAAHGQTGPITTRCRVLIMNDSADHLI